MGIIKTRNFSSVMLVLTVLILILSMPLGAYAAEYNRLGNLASVADEPDQELNTIKVTADSGELQAGDVVIFSLPEDFSFNASNEEWQYGSLEGGSVYYGDYDEGCYIYIPWDDENGLNMTVGSASQPAPTDILSVTSLDDNEIKIEVNQVEGYPSLVEDCSFFIYLKDVDVASGFAGAIEFSFNAPSGSGFGAGEIDGGRVGRIVEEEEPEVEADKPSDGTPSADSQDTGIVFTLGKTAFTVNGTPQTLDSAPYAKGGRTYLPMRYVAKALGIKDTNIQWKNGTAKFILDSKVVSVKVGSPVMTVDGRAVPIDAVPEIVNGRTMLPIKWIAEAFGVDVSWDAGTQTVTVK